MAVILEVRNLQKNFGQLTAVGDLSFEVKQGEILGLMGPNGAGKTTVFNLLTGVYKPDRGSIFFNGQDITEKTPHERCRLGLGRTYQIPQPFEKMTVFENLLVCSVHGGRMREKQAKPYVDHILDQINLSKYRNDFSGTLSLLDRKDWSWVKRLPQGPN